jgi:pilus assembly protein CpaE
MANSEILRVLPITSNELVLDSINSALGSEPKYFILDPSNLESNIMDGIYSLQPDYILLDFDYEGTDALSLIDSVTMQFPEIVVVVLLPQNKIDQSNNVILAGARAFLMQPLSQAQLLSTLQRVKELVARTVIVQQERPSSEPVVRSRGTFVVFSPRGGAGCSSVAINLALAIYEQLNEEVLLMDGKLLFGHVDVLLNLRTQNSLSDLVAHSGALDESLIRDVITEHVSGLKVLPSPMTISTGQGIRTDDLYSLLMDLQTVFGNIVIDSGNFLNENVVTYMDASHKIILVINPEIASLRDASQFFEVCRQLAYPKDKVLVVVNQFDKREGLSLDDIEKSLQVKVFGTLPWDHKASINSINRGIPVVLQRQNSALRKGYKELANKLVKFIEKGSVESPSRRSAPSDALSKSSRLG